MAKTKNKAPRRSSTAADMDGVYLLKLLLYVLLGSVWIKLGHDNQLNLPLPVGLFTGLLFSSHEHFRIDRKIEYAVLLVAMLVGYFAPYGLYINF
ncbi:MAG TPA: hypothetical protein VLF62_02640 [Candidatus Saccharimonadales bacterium]|nr:hypothetical protein [Candidatus Saccharimonadales bacterium]